MKKILFVIFIITICLLACKPHTDNIRTINGIITEVTGEYIYIDTEDGNGWAAEYESGYNIGDRVIITFDNMGTDCIYDDELISISLDRKATNGRSITYAEN